jgi:hypothetical protein
VIRVAGACGSSSGGSMAGHGSSRRSLRDVSLVPLSRAIRWDGVTAVLWLPLFSDDRPGGRVVGAIVGVARRAPLDPLTDAPPPHSPTHPRLPDTATHLFTSIPIPDPRARATERRGIHEDGARAPAARLVDEARRLRPRASAGARRGRGLGGWSARRGSPMEGSKATQRVSLFGCKRVFELVLLGQVFASGLPSD